MGAEHGLAGAAAMLLGTLALQGGWQPQAESQTEEQKIGTQADVSLEVIDLYEETGIALDKERELEMDLLEGTCRSRNISDWFSYSVSWGSEPVSYGEDGALTGLQMSVALASGEADYVVTWEEGGGCTAYFAPEGGTEMPYEIPDSFFSGSDEENPAQGSPVTLRALDTWLLERLFIELNNQDTEEYRGEYRICDYRVTNRYWTEHVIGTDVVFHVMPKAKRAEDLEYFQGLLARVGLTDTERIREIFADLQVPGEDEWRSVPHPELAAQDGMIPYQSEPSPGMEAAIEELKGMLTEEGYPLEEADRIANTVLFRYYAPCAQWLTQEREYSFCFRTELNESGDPVAILVDRSGAGYWNPYIPQLKTKEEQREAYFQAGYDEMDGMLKVMF